MKIVLQGNADQSLARALVPGAFPLKNFGKDTSAIFKPMSLVKPMRIGPMKSGIQFDPAASSLLGNNDEMFEELSAHAAASKVAVHD